VDEEVAIRAKALSFYICAFSNNQWNIDAEMGSSVQDTPFFKVLQAPTTKMVVMNVDQIASSLLRAWCVFEFFLSVDTQKSFILNTRFGPPDVLFESGIEAEMTLTHLFEVLQIMDIKQSSASVQGDLDMIHAHIETFKGCGVAEGLVGADALNRKIKSVVADCVLHVFVKWGRADKMQDALRLGANPNEPDAHGICPLTYATALHGQDGIQAQLLLQWGAMVEHKTHAEEVVDMFHLSGVRRAEAISNVEALDEHFRDVYSVALHCAHKEHVSRLARSRIKDLHAMDHLVRRAALESIANEPKLGAAYVDGVAECLRHEDAALRYFAAYALSRPGVPIRQYLRQLTDITNREDEEPGVVVMARRAIRSEAGGSLTALDLDRFEARTKSKESLGSPGTKSFTNCLMKDYMDQQPFSNQSSIQSMGSSVATKTFKATIQ
jgi:hypothetical protein